MAHSLSKAASWPAKLSYALRKRRASERPSPLIEKAPVSTLAGRFRSHRDSLHQHLDKTGNAASIAFTFCTVALAAKLAAVDNESNATTAEEFEAFCRIFSMPASDHNRLLSLFEEAAKDATPASYYARRIHTFYPQQDELKGELLDALFRFAGSDAGLNAREILLLKEIAQGLGFEGESFRQILKSHTLPSYRNPFDVLGVPRNVSAQALKTAYRNAVKDCHPDRFHGKAIPEDLMQVIRERFEYLTNAYDAVLLKRGFRQVDKKAA